MMIMSKGDWEVYREDREDREDRLTEEEIRAALAVLEPEEDDEGGDDVA